MTYKEIEKMVGETLSVSVTVKNTGDVGRWFEVEATTAELVGSKEIWIEPGETLTILPIKDQVVSTPGTYSLGVNLYDKETGEVLDSKTWFDVVVVKKPTIDGVIVDYQLD